jgi:hypothetical protein
MDKEETNGYLRALEGQLRAVEQSLHELDEQGLLNDKAHAVFRKVKVGMVNLRQDAMTIRAWNMTE